MIGIMELINAKYIFEMDPENLVTGDIKGIIALLDPFLQHVEKKYVKR
jgi:hypothetical protein